MATIDEEVSQSTPQTHRALVLTALVVAMFLAAIEGTIVATAMPSIAARLGGFSQYSWVFSSYLLMQAVMTPIFGKLSDHFGRKPMFVIGVLIFLVGATLCGLATSMSMLVAFRFLQGIGAGAVLPMSATLAGDLYSLRERGRIQGYLASVWGLSSILGPLAGGIIVDHVSWRWIFWLNLPFGMVSIILIWFFLHEKVEQRKRSIDFAGAGLLLVGLSALMLALTQASEWGVRSAGGLAAIAVITLAIFLRQQRSAPDPMMHFELWRDPIIRLGNLAILCAGIAMIGLITFLPTFVQGVLGGSALAAGFTLSGMSIGWPLASVIAGRSFIRLGVRVLVRAGGAFTVAGSLVIGLFASDGALWAGIGAFLMGIGFGLLNTTYIVAIQTSVGWAQRGVATSTNMLMRNLGNALGAAMLGGVLNLRLGHLIQQSHLESVISLDSVRDLIQEGAGAAVAVPHAALEVLQRALQSSLGLVFWVVAAFAVAILIISWRVPDLTAEKIEAHR